MPSVLDGRLHPFTAGDELTNHVTGMRADPGGRNRVHLALKCPLSTYYVSHPEPQSGTDGQKKSPPWRHWPPRARVGVD